MDRGCGDFKPFVERKRRGTNSPPAYAPRLYAAIFPCKISVPDGFEPVVTSENPSLSPLTRQFLGIVVASHARTQGYGAHEVIAYTVHDNDAADAELAKLNCRYALKGRPEVLKRVISASLAEDPPSRRRMS